MKASFTMKLFVVLISLNILSKAKSAPSSKWTYGEYKGPSDWPSVNPICGLPFQSPIDIKTAQCVIDQNLRPLVFEGYYQSLEGAVYDNNGHTISLALTNQGETMSVTDERGQKYTALQLHFHWTAGKAFGGGSEHTVNGDFYPVEMHIVHIKDPYTSLGAIKDLRDGLLVVGVMLKEDNSVVNSPYSQVLNTMPKFQGVETSVTGNYTLDSLLPSSGSFWRYDGSLTTPPCFQSVKWTVLQEPVLVPSSVISRFSDEIYGTSEPASRELLSASDLIGGNFRPVQPLSGRTVTEFVEFDDSSVDEIPADLWKKGAECRRTVCFNSEGHFDQNNLYHRSYFSFKTLYFFNRANFVVYLRNIKNPKGLGLFLQLCDSSGCTNLASTDDQVFVFENTRHVSLLMYGQDVTFEAQYYAGCQLVKGSEFRFDAKYMKQPKHCWVMIKDSPVHTSNVFLSDLNLPNGVELSLYNSITGVKYLNMKNGASSDLASIDATENKILHQNSNKLSSFLILTGEGCTKLRCSTLSFKLIKQDIGPSENACFKKKQACDFELPGASSYECNHVEECDAFDQFQRILQPKFDVTSEGVVNNYSEMCKILFKNRVKETLCKRNKSTKTLTPDCQQFGKCANWCAEERNINNICRQSLVLSVDALL